MNIKNKSSNCAVIPTQLLEDERISLEAKGLMCFLFAKKENCQINILALANEIKSDEETIRGPLKELLKAGWLENNDAEAGNDRQ
jgi:hypothetical protein